MSIVISSGMTGVSSSFGNDTMVVSKGGAVFHTSVSSGGLISLAGYAEETVMTAGASMFISGGGTASATTLQGSAESKSGAYMLVSSGGTALQIDVKGKNDCVSVSGGGIAVDVYVSSGNMYVYSGAKVSSSVACGGAIIVYNGGIMVSGGAGSGGVLNIESGGNVSVADVSGSGAVVNISGGGVMYVGNIHDSGLANIQGGAMNGALIGSGGTVRIFSGGEMLGGSIQGSAIVFDGGFADAPNILSGYLNIQHGGVVCYPAVFNSGRIDVNDGGVLSGGVIRNGGVIRVYNYGLASGADIRANGVIYVSDGGSAINTVIQKGGCCSVGSGGECINTVVSSGGTMRIASGGTISETLILNTGAVCEVYSGAVIDFTVANRKTTDAALISGLSLIVNAGYANYTITTSASMELGTYKLAESASGFANTVTVKTTENQMLGALSVGETLRTSYGSYTLNLTGGSLIQTVDDFVVESPRVNFEQNGVSQILAWDAEQGKVGYMATDGNIAPGWQGVWEWSGSEASMWKVVGAGHFAGSAVEQDGVLLYNGYGNTFAAWTNLNDGSYGYVSLCHVDGNFQTKCIADFDNNGFDDVIIYDEKGSVGIVSDAQTYHDVWHVDNPSANSWQIVGAGRFHGESDSIVFKNTSNNHLYLWDNNDLSFSTWDWSQTDIGGISDGWEVAAIGDFQGDGIDDIALINHNDNDAVFVWDDGDCSTAHYVGCLGSGFKIESVGDYNGDGKEDLLLREYNSGWGGVGYWASADASQWTDLNARIETNMESKFAIIA